MAPGNDGTISNQEDLLAQLALMQKTIKEQEEKLKKQEETHKEKEEKIKKAEREKLIKLKKEKERLEKIKKEEEERLRKQLEEKENEKKKIEQLKQMEEEKYRRELKEKEKKAKEREEQLALEMKRREEEKEREMERERMELRAKEEKLKEREDRISVLENRSSLTNSAMSDADIDDFSLYQRSPSRRRSSVPDSTRTSPCDCFLHGFKQCIYVTKHNLCDCCESCAFVKEYFTDSSKLEEYALHSTNAQWASKHIKMIQEGRKCPPTPPSYDHDRILATKTPVPPVNMNIYF